VVFPNPGRHGVIVRSICGKVDDWTLVLKRSQGPRGTFVVKLRTGPALVLKRSQGKRNICGKVDDWTLVLKRSQGPRGTFVVKLMTGHWF
jgi:hypothetical protein